MPVGVVTNAREEHKWERAKQIAADQGHEKDWQYIMGIYKKMNPTRFKQASFDRYYNKYFNSIKYAFLNGPVQPVQQPVQQPVAQPVARPVAQPVPQPGASSASGYLGRLRDLGRAGLRTIGAPILGAPPATRGGTPGSRALSTAIGYDDDIIGSSVSNPGGPPGYFSGR